MISIKKESLQKALEYCFISKLPDKEDGKNLWIRAIAEVEKKDGTSSYAYIEKDPDTLENKIKADFGKPVQINKIVSIHPFCYLDAGYIPEFKFKKGKDEAKAIEERRIFLDNITGVNHKGKKLKELDSEILSLSIKKQLRIEKSANHAE